MISKKGFLKFYYILAGLFVIFFLTPYGGKWAWLINSRWIFVFMLAFFVANISMPLVIKLAWKYKILDIPDSERKVHTEPTPRIGGLAIYAAFVIAVIRNFQFSQELMGLLVGATLVFVVGLWDDIKPRSAAIRLLFQLAGGLIVALSGSVIEIVPNSWFMQKELEIIITVLWLVGISNCINLLDGIDGLAGSLVAVSSFFFFWIAVSTGQKHLSYLAMALMGACAGFLPYNWQKAKVFLGDSGATFIGFLLAGFAVYGEWSGDNPIVALSTPILILGIPIFDLIYTTISRIKNGSIHNIKEWLEFTGKDHFHHRLMNLKFSVPQAVFFILLLNMCFGTGVLALHNQGITSSILMMIQAVMIFMIVVVLMLKGREIS